MSSDDYQVQFRALQVQFLSGLRQREAALREAITPQDVHAQLHRLAGAAGVYGYAELGDRARAIMHRLDQEGHEAVATEIADFCRDLLAQSSAVPNDTI